MKTPSKNMSASLRGQGKDNDTPRVSRQTAPSAAGTIIPGEHGVEKAPGKNHARSVEPFAGAVGGHFGGSK
jgi:hypothetical protein